MRGSGARRRPARRETTDRNGWSADVTEQTSLPAGAPEAALAMAAALALGLQVAGRLQTGDEGAVLVLWQLTRYFTILTVAGVAVVLARAALIGRQPGPTLAGGLALAAIITGLIYHLLLAHLEDPQGLRYWSNLMLHTVVPAGAGLWWLLRAPKAGLGPRDLGLWVLYPAGYAAYAVARGVLGDRYPYPFLDLEELGWAGLLREAGGVAAAYLAAGALLLLAARITGRVWRSQSASPGSSRR